MLDFGALCSFENWTVFSLGCSGSLTRAGSHLASQVESAGTVLSTNWKDVGKRKVAMSPPEDVEFKKY